jgi:hypothetical protein
MPFPEKPLCILDAIGPFLTRATRHRVNWSKIDFSLLEKDGTLCPEARAEITPRFAEYCKRIAADGANAIAVDDLAHLYIHPGYPESLQRKLTAYRDAYREWFAIARDAGLGIYVNTDILFYVNGTVPPVGTSVTSIADFLKEACGSVFETFPEIQGVFFRLGECDGHDVQNDFLSKLVIRTPREANRLLREMLPMFEDCGKKFILRTWTVGAYPIGDLIWNPRTLEKLLQGLDSPALVLSMKFGESDFFRHLKLNRHFFRTPVAKLVELQAKREYEGCGEYPSFTGFDDEAVLRQLEDAENMLGIHLWCQTGGWTAFRRITYLQPEGIWNEINSFTALRMVRDRYGVEQALAAFITERRPDISPQRFQELLRLSDEIIRELLYLPEFARQEIYFRRTRLPPQLMVYWDRIFVNHTLRKVLRCFVKDPATSVRQSQAALRKIDRMRALTSECGLPVDDIDFMRDTFAILAAARAYCLLPYNPHALEALTELKARYKRNWKHRYRYAVKLDFNPQHLPRARFQLLFRLFFRHNSRYRRIDKFLTVWLLGKLYPLLRIGRRRFFMKFADKQAMGIGTVFR